MSLGLDCSPRSVLEAIINPAKRTSQKIIYAIFRAANNLKTQGISLRLQWIPGHCSNSGSDKADRLAKEAVGSNVSHPFQRSVNGKKRYHQDKILAEWENQWRSSSRGQHLRQVDPKLPSQHTWQP